MIATGARRIGAVALLVMVLTACDGESIPFDGRPVLVLRTSSGAVRLHVAVARTEAERARGLMGRTHLGPNAGMVFVFPKLGDQPFWMKDTLIPLSIAFWDSRGRIVDVRDMTPCRREPCPLYVSAQPYVGAVEANRGYFARHGVDVGDRVELEHD